MKKTNRLIDFFAVIGPDQQFTINDPDIEQGIPNFFISFANFSNVLEKSITGLEIINGYFNNQIDTNKDNMEEWIDLDGTRTVWLKINFNQKYIPPITHLEFLYMPQEGEYLVTYRFFHIFLTAFQENPSQPGMPSNSSQKAP